ncbi:MAG: AAA family ATPase, partial [Nitrospirota bacterium]
MDYLNFFGFKEDPFKLTPDPAYFYPSSSHNEGLLLMDYSIQQKEGFLLIIGDPGTGKTTLLNVFLERWKLRAEIAVILTPRLSPEEFLISVVDDLNIKLENRNKNEIIKALRDFMIKKSIEDKRIVIVVDEAQNLPDETLEELRLLSNLETDKDKLIQIILTGQPELESKLMTERLRQLNQRITTRIHLKHFNPDETLDYINYRLIKAGKRNLKIDKKAGKLAHKLSNGVPRLINMLISRALMAAYLEESNIISQMHITHAVKSLGHSELKIQGQNRLIPLYAGLSFILLSGVGGYFYLQNIYIRTQNTEHRAQTTEVRSQNIETKT